MANATPAAMSRIPKVNFSAKKIRRSVSVAELSTSALQTPTVGERITVPSRNAIGSTRVARQDNFRKPLTDGNGLRARTTSMAKLPTGSARVEAAGRKRPAAATISNQTSKAKIPAWDTKALLKQAEDNLAKAKEKVEELTTVSSDQEEQLLSLKATKLRIERELREKTDALNSTEISLKDSKEKLAALQVKYTECCCLSQELTQTVECLRTRLDQKEQTINILQGQVDELRVAYDKKSTSYTVAAATLSDKEASLKSYMEECARLKEQVVAQDIKRQIMHNTIMELKGNIRVFCRVRPLLATELALQASIDHLMFVDENSMEVVKGPKKTKSSFSFDRAFSPTTTQMEIFEELAELVQSLIDGYNVCVFAYGQTGSGKTYTMEGGLGPEEKGMIPRSVERIFNALENSPTGWKYKAETCFLEIYNEQVRDLLESGSEKKSYEIRNPATPGADMVVTNLKVETVSSAGEVYSLLNIARRNRAVAATVHNDYSSRSHFVFKLRLLGENENTGKKIDAVLNLVDLAGSEKLVEISENARVAETKNINRSLSNLGNVILALSRKNEHVPYRNSKLTHLLQTSLGGNSKTLMLVNLSPKEDAVEETLNSLRFATRVNECYVGRAQRNIK